jgi:hypothetical protein
MASVFARWEFTFGRPGRGPTVRLGLCAGSGSPGRRLGLAQRVSRAGPGAKRRRAESCLFKFLKLRKLESESSHGGAQPGLRQGRVPTESLAAALHAAFRVFGRP